MAATEVSRAWWQTPQARALSILLILQAAAFYGFSRKETPPPHRPLREFPVQIGAWQMVEEGVVEPEIQEVLKADDTLNRTYFDPARGLPVGLFVAYFKSQRTGANPHSPKNCLPGGGWAPLTSDSVAIPVPGRQQPIQVNRYIIAKGENRSAVLYWYQSRNRVIASEYWAKFYLVADAIRYNRTDTALVRITVPVAAEQEQAAVEAGISFAQACFPHLEQFLPR